MSRASLRAYINGSPDPNRPLLLAEGFAWSPRFAGCWLREELRGSYVVFIPADTRSGKYEAWYQTADNTLRVDFPPGSARTVLRHVRKHAEENDRS